MSSLAVVFGRSQKAQIDVLQLDASVSETHSRKSKISTNEIEDGSQINDHITLDPETLTIEGVISEAPLSLAQALANVATTAAGGALGGKAGALATAGIASLSSNLLKTSQNPSVDALFKLEELWNERIPFVVVTGLKTYKNMVIESISIPRSKDIGKSLRFTVSLMQLKIVRSKTVIVPEANLDEKAGHSAASKANIGKQKAAAASAATTRGSSVAFDLVGGLF